MLQNIASYLTQRDPWHFTRLLEERYRLTIAEQGLVIVDLRRPEELIWARANGFFIVKLAVTREQQIARGAEPDCLDHVTETALDGAPAEAFDLVVPSTMTVDEAVSRIIGTIWWRYDITPPNKWFAGNDAATTRKPEPSPIYWPTTATPWLPPRLYTAFTWADPPPGLDEPAEPKG